MPLPPVGSDHDPGGADCKSCLQPAPELRALNAERLDHPQQRRRALGVDDENALAPGL
jgi:hypothetical protein